MSCAWPGRTVVTYPRVFVARLRQKRGDDPAQPRYIQTEWHTGYRFAPSAHPPPPIDFF